MLKNSERLCQIVNYDEVEEWSVETSQVYNVKVIEHSEGLTGQCLELPGAISEGKTLEELKANMKEAIELVLEEIHESSKSDTFAIEITRK